MRAILVILLAASIARADELPPNDRLVGLTAQGDLAAVKAALDGGLSPDARAMNSITPLIMAAYAGRVEIVRLLLKRGATPGLVNSDGESPLIAGAKSPTSDVVVPLLIAAHADVNAYDIHGCTPLAMHAREGHRGAVRALLAAGARPDEIGTDGQTPLFESAAHGQLELVKLFLSLHARVDQKNRMGATPLLVAAVGGHAGVVRALLAAGADPKIMVDDKNALGFACMNDHADAAGVLATKIDVNAPAAQDDPPLMIAAIAGSAKVVPVLVKAGAKLDLVSKLTPLEMASARGHTTTVRALLDAGAKVEQSGVDGATPLLIAAYAGHLEIVKMLVERGAKLEHTNPQGGTPLRSAAEKGHVEIVRYLVGKGANTNPRDSFNKLPIDYARENNHAHVVELLKELRR